MSHACLTAPRLQPRRPVRSHPPDLPVQQPRPPKGTLWGGRAKGTPNKLKRSIREAIQMAFEQVGGVEYLVRLAQEDPKMFVLLLVKTMPPEPKVPREGGLNIVIDLT